MSCSRQAAIWAFLSLLPTVAGCGEGVDAAGRRQGLGSAEICVIAFVLMLLTIPVGIVLLVLRGRSKRTGPPSPPRTDARHEGGIQVFVSYRRSDSPDATGRIYDALVARFSKNCVFKDVDSIPLGEDFRHVLQAAVARADVVIVVIGPRWVDAKDASGRRRLDDENDFVRIEIEAALAQGIPVIPVLISHTTMVAEADLPASLRQLAYRNGIPVRPDPDFHRDIDRLAAALQRQPPPADKPVSDPAQGKPPMSSGWLIGCAVAALAALALIFILLLLSIALVYWAGAQAGIDGDVQPQFEWKPDAGEEKFLNDLAHQPPS